MNKPVIIVSAVVSKKQEMYINHTADVVIFEAVDNPVPPINPVNSVVH